MNKILIIDDDKELCALIQKSVLRENIETDYSHSGMPELVKLKEKDYHLIILDIMKKLYILRLIKHEARQEIKNGGLL